MGYRDYDIPIGGGGVHYGYCQGGPGGGEPFANLNEVSLGEFYVYPPHTYALVNADCIPYDKTDGNLVELQVNVLRKYTENLDGTISVELILLFLNPTE